MARATTSRETCTAQTIIDTVADLFENSIRSPSVLDRGGGEHWWRTCRPLGGDVFGCSCRAAEVTTAQRHFEFREMKISSVMLRRICHCRTSTKARYLRRKVVDALSHEA
jgi:hypothetical protein